MKLMRSIGTPDAPIMSTGKKGFAAIVRGVGVIRAGSQLMCAQKVPRREIVGLVPFNAMGAARLPVEESSLCRIDQKLIGSLLWAVTSAS